MAKTKNIVILDMEETDHYEDIDDVTDELDDWMKKLDPNVCGFCRKDKPTPSIQWYSCVCGGAGYCCKLCQKNDWDRSHKTFCAMIPLWRATLLGDLASVLVALQRKHVRVNLEHPLFGMNAVSICIIKEHPACLLLLIENGASIELSNPYGMSPVHMACSVNSPNCLLLLLASGADVDKRTSDIAESSAVAICCVKGNVRCLSICLVAGANPDQVGQNNSSAARGACQFGYHKCLQMLISQGADVEVVRNNQSPSPLDYAFSNKHHACIGLLLAEGATFIDGMFVTEPEYVQVCDAYEIIIYLSHHHHRNKSGGVQDGKDQRQEEREAPPSMWTPRMRERR